MKKMTIWGKSAGWAIVLMALLFTACKKDNHFIGGSPTNDHTDLTTYDYLKKNPLFDTLILLIDKAGLKETINSNVTFVAPTDYAIKALLAIRTTKLQKETNDENVKYTLDSLKAPELRDSLLAYVFDGPIVRADLSLDITQYKNKVGEPFYFRLVKSTDFSDILSAGVRYMSVAKIINGLDPDPLPEKYPDDDKDKISVLQTTGIITKTGVLHVLENRHVFYWK
ncbi:MAG: fasciclin domain-containing protein [Chitinophaga sp.]|uniref:fasciclin domain-containing protein n=1 Tax=Chitinophaga sp. TaxID=1869181 RepID=UPI001B21A476|nr:fasciclin domain-containing protein [Chitinophaga sp.]MBO9732020.1 fasciclin domain-containing protein [Chitinophaga sp.]